MRPEEQARREAQTAAARGEQQETQTVQIPLTRRVIYDTFIIPGVARGDDGSATLQFGTPDGTLHIWPLSAEEAKRLGSALVAPSVEIASPGDMPRNGGGAAR